MATKTGYIILSLRFVVVESPLIKDFFTAASLWPKRREIYTPIDNDFKNIPAVLYELPFENEEFLREGLELIDQHFSQLDLCQHRAISLLKKSCNQLTSEEIGRLGIMLLNFQFEGEGRGTFPCTTEMTLKQCTIGMDNNAYQIYSYMTNHAISICSSKKQEHFRAIKELAVRKLFPTTQNQLTVNNGVKTKLEELTKLYNQLSEFFSQVSSYIVNYIKSNILKLLLHGVATYFNVGTPIALLIPHIPKLVRFVKLFFL